MVVTPFVSVLRAVHMPRASMNAGGESGLTTIPNNFISTRRCQACQPCAARSLRMRRRIDAASRTRVQDPAAMNQRPGDSLSAYPARCPEAGRGLWDAGALLYRLVCRLLRRLLWRTGQAGTEAPVGNVHVMPHCRA